ncbi:alcohol dehydrogenase [Cladochytrium replicatum]|nr:alcohol dehydrogenase [Cladochytrium replicatum]
MAARAASRTSVLRVMNSVASSTSARCPCHGGASAALTRQHVHHPGCGHDHAGHGRRSMGGVKEDDREYAFEMATSAIRYGPGATSEIGMDVKNMRANKVAVFTDKNIAKLRAGLAVVQSLERNGVAFELFDRVRVEPTDSSFMDAIEFARRTQPDVIVAVGGGSVIDTAKAANLYSCYPEADLLEFVNAPIGKGRPVDRALKPLIAVPTTAGTGSETTGVAIFDYEPKKFKTGIASRSLKPTLGIVDPLNTRTMPPEVHVSSGLDVLCHALESYTAIPFNERTPRPRNPIERPAYQGANPISDMWSLKALKMCVENLPSAYKNRDDTRAQDQMILAATYAGIGFGNAGVHLCHGLSYPISGLNKSYKHKGYDVDHKIVPHGISVAITSPAVFAWTSPACPDRHLEAAKIFGVDISNAKREDAGLILSEALRKFLHGLDVPDGISALGFKAEDIPNLVEGTLPQHRVTKMAPKAIGAEEIASIFEKSLKMY